MTRTMKRCGAVAMMLLLAASAMGQSAATAEMHVMVKDPNGAVVRNATVTAVQVGRNFERSTTLNTDGEYQMRQLPPGQYVVTVEAPGFAKVVAKDLTLTVGQRVEVPVTLSLASVTEVVNVSAEPELVETQRSSSTSTITEERIVNLPINGRSYINFTLTNSQATRDTAPSIGAAPTSGINIGGQRARSNLVNVDGADAVDNSTNGIRSTVSQEAVQEFQVITNGYNAEYGRASGGVVNIITRSGSNSFHGSAFGYLRHRSFQADNPFSNVKDPAYTRVQTGLSLSGPIKQNQTFYFFSYETTRRQETGFSTIGSNNYKLVPFNTSTIGLPFGTVLLSNDPSLDQVSFVTRFAQALPTLPPALQAQLAPVLGKYVVVAGGSAGLAVNRAMPAAIAVGGGFSAPTVFPSSNFPIPQSYVGLRSLEGNYPVSEGTSNWSMRLDHKLTNNQNAMVRVGVSPSTVTGIQVNAQNQNFGQNSFSRTSVQTFRDFNSTAQHTWTLGNNKVNEFRFQFSRRGLAYTHSRAPGGSGVGVNIPGFAFFGREPFSFVRRTEKRFQFTDNFSLSKGNHNLKWGVDVNHLPLEADFTVNFGGVVGFSQLEASSLGFPTTIPGINLPVPGFSPVQAYGLGIPQSFVQGVGNPHDKFTNTPVGAFLQDSWRVNNSLTLNLGVRYDVEFTPIFPAANAMSANAQNLLGIVQGIPRDYNNVAPRIGLAWDLTNDGKTVLRSSYGMFYGHPLLALAFNSDVADGAQAPQLIFFGSAPGCGTSLSTAMNATNIFQGILATCPNTAGFNYLPQEQRFNPTPNAPSVFLNQQYLNSNPPVPVVVQPWGLPTGADFEYQYAHQANFTIERDLGHNYALGLEYNFNGGRHLPRPINTNTVRTDLLVRNWQRAVQAAVAAGQTPPSNPLFVTGCGTLTPANPVAGAYVPAAVVSFFRPSGFNPSLTPGVPASCLGLATGLLQSLGFNTLVPVPFSDMTANLSNGSSVYHGMTANLRKRFSKKYEFSASYTWSHAIDDSTDLQTLLAPQDNYRPDLERANSVFDQRHRFVFSGVYNTGKLSGQGFVPRLFSEWTIAPIIEVSSGRPFTILTGGERNFDFTPYTDRPLIVPAGRGVNACGDQPVANQYSPTGFFQLPCFIEGTFNGNLGRNSATRPHTVFTDLRVSRRISFTEHVKLDAIADMFNLINRFNVADVNPLFTENGRPTSAFDPRQFQFALKLSW